MPSWVRIASEHDLLPGECGEYVAGERIVALFNVAGTSHALDGICPHQGGPLGPGLLTGCIVTRPWHGFQFDVTPGQHQTSRSLIEATFPVRVEGAGVCVDWGVSTQ